MTGRRQLASRTATKVAEGVNRWLADWGLISEAEAVPHNHDPEARPTPYRYQQGCRHVDCIRANRLYYHAWRERHGPEADPSG